MSKQEMQFADPDWRPQQQGKGNSDSGNQERYIAQPVNNDRGEQFSRQSVSPQQEKVYPGYADYRAQPRNGGQLSPRQRSMRRNPVLWIILALMLFALLGSMGHFNSFHGPFNGIGHRAPYDSFHGEKPRTFSLGSHPTIIINDSFGNITVHADSHATDVTIQTDNSNALPIQYIPSQDGQTLTVSVNDTTGDASSNGVDFDVTVPTTANLDLKTTSGNIEVSDVTGQLALTSDSGDVSVALSNSSFQVDATTTSGDINDDYGLSGSSSNELQGTVGYPPLAKVTIKTGSGSINLQKHA